MLAGGFIHWIFQAMREATIHSQLGHIQITRPGYFRQGLSNPYHHLLPPSTQAITNTLTNATAFSVETIAPRLTFNGLISKGEQTISFSGDGIDPAKETAIARSIRIVDGQNLTAPNDNTVLLGRGLAANLGAKAGDKVVLLVTTAQAGVNAVEASVVGIFATASKAYDDAALRAPLETVRKLMRVEGATTWVALLNDTAQTDIAVSELRRTLDPKEFEITPWSDLADFYNKTVDLFTRQVAVVRVLIALIIILTISNIMSMSVVERTSEIGTAMAMGVKRGTILAQFLWEGAVLGGFGAVIGVGLSYLLATGISAIGIPMPPPPGMATGYTGEILITRGLAADGFLLAFATALIASLFPAWKASRMNIVDALRHQR